MKGGFFFECIQLEYDFNDFNRLFISLDTHNSIYFLFSCCCGVLFSSAFVRNDIKRWNEFNWVIKVFKQPWCESRLYADRNRSCLGKTHFHRVKMFFRHAQFIENQVTIACSTQNYTFMSFYLLQGDSIKLEDFTLDVYRNFLDSLCPRPELNNIFKMQ